MIDWEKYRRPYNSGHKAGTLDLIEALNDLPDVKVKGFDLVTASDYILTVESLSPITSKQVAAVVLTTALSLGYEKCYEIQE